MFRQERAKPEQPTRRCVADNRDECREEVHARGFISITVARLGPAGVDAIVLSHAHIDHCGGIMNDVNARNFPNAQIVLSESDSSCWTDEHKVPAPCKAFLLQAQNNLVLNREHIRFFKDREEILPAIHAISVPGHTAGDTILMIDQGGAQLCYTADLSHHQVLLLEQPLAQFGYDTDPVQSRRAASKC